MSTRDTSRRYLDTTRPRYHGCRGRLAPPRAPASLAGVAPAPASTDPAAVAPTGWRRPAGRRAGLRLGYRSSVGAGRPTAVRPAAARSVLPDQYRRGCAPRRGGTKIDGPEERRREDGPDPRPDRR